MRSRNKKHKAWQGALKCYLQHQKSGGLGLATRILSMIYEIVDPKLDEEARAIETLKQYSNFMKYINADERRKKNFSDWVRIDDTNYNKRQNAISDKAKTWDAIEAFARENKQFFAPNRSGRPF